MSLRDAVRSIERSNILPFRNLLPIPSRLSALETLLLRTYDFPGNAPRVVEFLKAHGEKLRRIDFRGSLCLEGWDKTLLDYCPKVRSFKIESAYHHVMRPEVLRCSQPHRHLKCLSIASPPDQYEPRSVTVEQTIGHD